MRDRRLAALVAALALAGCASLAPPVPEPAPQVVPLEWPLPPLTPSRAVPSQDATAVATADVGWREFFAAPQLADVIALALANNRDLRIAALNIERARASYRIQRADQVPNVNFGGAATWTGDRNGKQIDGWTAAVDLANYEIDFFGRVRDLSRAALQQYLAEEETRRAAQLSLVAEVANAWTTLAADRELLALAELTLRNRTDALALTERRKELGAISGLELAQQRTTVETARTDVARYAGQVARDLNALRLLVGADVPPDLLPATFAAVEIGVAPPPAGLPSEVLLRRPDMLAAEHRLLAANANIGAARAAFFPSIKLTAGIGTASDALFGLLSGASPFWTFGPRITLPIFDGGRLQGNLDAARADQAIALASYERAIQAGFREVADGLALSGTLAAQREAQEALVAAAVNADELSEARYKAGRDSYLVQLDAQRTRYAAEQSLIQTRLAEQANRITLYKVLGGGWKETRG
jgi:multidrug efflux system outer membrane protein